MSEKIKEILYYFEKYHFEDTMIDGKETKLLYDYITDLQNQLQQKENIIKEVREMFKDYGEKEDIVGYSMYNITGEMLLKLLEMLDKDSDKE